MKSIEESVVESLDGSDKNLFQFLPYILQDLWEIGTDPETVLNITGRHFPSPENLKVLDLGCGKGAVSIKLSKAFGCRCHGIDAMPEFINYAREKAVEFHVENLCIFEIGDIRERIKSLSSYDVIILGAIGPLLGEYYSTLSTLSNCIKENGIIIIDDAYIDDDSDYSHPVILKYKTILEQIDLAGMQLVENEVMPKDDIKKSDDSIFENIRKRCFELKEKYPDNRKLFEEYISQQASENVVLENKVVCSTMVIKPK